jgi:RimJ/RimL family protein N-acetyltransferase
MSMPTLQTERLVLRPYRLSDASAVQELAGHREVASTTLNIPHPYEDGMAEEWIAGREKGWEDGEMLVLAITIDGDELVGAISLKLALEHRRAELGYWIAVPHWGHGYATEAARAMLGYGFAKMGLHRIEATYLTRNPASARVMEKLGMSFEGVQREHTVKWGVAEDLGRYGILATEWTGQAEGTSTSNE